MPIYWDVPEGDDDKADKVTQSECGVIKVKLTKLDSRLSPTVVVTLIIPIFAKIRATQKVLFIQQQEC